MLSSLKEQYVRNVFKATIKWKAITLISSTFIKTHVLNHLVGHVSAPGLPVTVKGAAANVTGPQMPLYNSKTRRDTNTTQRSV